MSNLPYSDSNAAAPAAHGAPRERQKRISARRKAKRMVLGSAAFAVLFAAAAALLSWAIDPLQHYRKAWYKPIYSNEERYQNAGLARNYSYDTIILGTSMTENFLPSKVEEALGGGKVMKLSLRGSTMPEQYETARLALSTGQVKKVLWGIDYFALRTEGDDGGQQPFPSYLYDDSFWNDARYWFSITPYQELAKGALKQIFRQEGTELELLGNWDRWVEFGSKQVMADYRKAKQSEAYFGLNEDSLASVQGTFDKYVLSLVKAYPQVKFYFYYPPYSVLRHAVWLQTNPVRYANQLTMRVWMFERLHELPNAEVYDFQSESRWTFDLDQYKDLSHHRGQINTEIAEAIGRQDPAYLMTEANSEQRNEALEQQVRSIVVREEDNSVAAYPVSIGGREVSFSDRSAAGDSDLLVPAKELAAALGASLNWDASSKTIAIRHGKDVIAMTAEKPVAVINGTHLEAPSPARLIRGKIQIPLIFIAESLGLHVQQNAESPAVTEISINEG